MDGFESLIDNFKQDLLDYDPEYLIEKYLIFGNPYIFRSKDYLYFELKKELSSHFNVKTSEVFMIGSSKLGFSISPKKLWIKMDENVDSDIDMVILSEQLFDIFWKDLLDFRIELTSRNECQDRNYQKFVDYFFKGWLRPDLFPFDYHNRNDWFDFFNELSYKKYDKRKVSCAVFRNEYFFKKYHTKNLNQIRVALIDDRERNGN
jgi:hypothetical protein